MRDSLLPYQPYANMTASSSNVPAGDQAPTTLPPSSGTRPAPTTPSFATQPAPLLLRDSLLPYQPYSNPGLPAANQPVPAVQPVQYQAPVNTFAPPAVAAPRAGSMPAPTMSPPINLPPPQSLPAMNPEPGDVVAATEWDAAARFAHAVSAVNESPRR
jgi:hypothetical protein